VSSHLWQTELRNRRCVIRGGGKATTTTTTTTTPTITTTKTTPARTTSVGSALRPRPGKGTLFLLRGHCSNLHML